MTKEVTRAEIKKKGDDYLLMRIAQGISVPRIVTDNPKEFGFIFDELQRRRTRSNWYLAIGVALISGIIGLASAAAQHYFGW